MEKIIEGKIYSTETAILIADWSYGYRNDAKYIHEELYLSKKGQWFIFGEGESSSDYGLQVATGTFSSSEKLYLVDEEDAKDFLEEHGDADIYQKYFEVEEG
ncbi:hypothetical protein ACYSNU_07180 [Enterococcus sp. LJL120]